MAGRDMAGVAEASERARASGKSATVGDFRAVLKSATGSILAAEAFRKPYPLIHFTNFFPGDFYGRLVQRFPGVERFAGLNGDGTRREYAL